VQHGRDPRTHPARLNIPMKEHDVSRRAGALQEVSRARERMRGYTVPAILRVKATSHRSCPVPRQDLNRGTAGAQLVRRSLSGQHPAASFRIYRPTPTSFLAVSVSAAACGPRTGLELELKLTRCDGFPIFSAGSGRHSLVQKRQFDAPKPKRRWSARVRPDVGSNGQSPIRAPFGARSS